MAIWGLADVLRQLSGRPYLARCLLHGNGVRLDLNTPLLTFGIPFGGSETVLILERLKKEESFSWGAKIPESGDRAIPAGLRSDEMRSPRLFLLN